jgi:hypothetical protein
MTVRHANIVLLKDQPIVRLIPSDVLEPKLRIVANGEVLEGEAFSLEKEINRAEEPGLVKKASPVMQEKILASFDFSRLKQNRFNGVGDKGVFYAGTTLPASIHEIKYHLENDPGIAFDRTRVYRVVTGKVSGRFLDLRGVETSALDPDTNKGYEAGNKVARQVSEKVDGIIYPSTRNKNGICIAVFSRDAIKDLKLDKLISFELINKDKREYGYRFHTQPFIKQKVMEFGH